MKHEALMNMSKTDLDNYAKMIGLDVSNKKTIPKKVEAIESRRQRVGEIDVLGVHLVIPIKRLQDKRVTDLVGKQSQTDEEASELMMLVLGEEQYQSIIAAATDDDGTVDVIAMGLALATILNSPELKNY